MRAESDTPFLPRPEELGRAAWESVVHHDPLPLDPVVLHGGTVWVELPVPPAGTLWRVEWAVVGADGQPGPWRAVAERLLDGGEHLVRDDPPVPQHEARWRAVASPTGPTGDAERP